MHLKDAVKPVNYSFRVFEMPFDIEPREDDPIRTWTISEDGHRRLRNGLSMTVDLSILTIVR